MKLERVRKLDLEFAAEERLAAGAAMATAGELGES
jgi:hypothetical protein